jgi:hypothetical protein
MPLVCMYLYVFVSIWSICVYEFADTCRYMQIHTDTCRYMHIHTYTRRLGYTWQSGRMSLHWDHWHGITSEVHWGHCHVILGNHFTEAIDTGYYLTAPYRRAGPTTFYFRNSCENSKSSARCYGSQLTLLSKQNLPGFLLIPIFHWLFSTDQLSWF